MLAHCAVRSRIVYTQVCAPPSPNRVLYSNRFRLALAMRPATRLKIFRECRVPLKSVTKSTPSADPSSTQRHATTNLLFSLLSSARLGFHIAARPSLVYISRVLSASSPKSTSDFFFHGFSRLRHCRGALSLPPPPPRVFIPGQAAWTSSPWPAWTPYCGERARSPRATREPMAQVSRVVPRV